MDQITKKILLLNYEFPPLGGGGGVAAYKLAKSFVVQGYQVDYLTTWFKGLKKFEVVEGINVYRIKVFGRQELPTATMISLLSFPFCAFLKGFKLCWQNKYDFINTHFVMPTGPLGFLLGKMFRIKNILSLIGGDIYDPTKKTSPHKHWYWRVINKFLINQADALTAISSDTKKNTIQYYAPKKEIQVIAIPYESVDFKKVSRPELGLAEDKKYIIGVGRLVKRKGFEYFIRALALLPDEIEGIIIGDGPEADELEKLAGDLGVHKRLHLLGYLPTEEKKFQYLANSDVFVLSSLHEGFGIVLQEAMQVGLPIVATNNGGQADFIKDQVNGFLVEPKDEKALAEKILLLINNNEMRQQISRCNLNDIKNFNPANITGQYLELLK